ncbi:MAG: hypothetical protein KAH77_05330 [Thiomargarita sp.]|nr:hypothetical protein [Thiomargarita sp.]
MSTDYYASLSPVSMTRKSLLLSLSQWLSDIKAILDPDFYRLALKNGYFEYTGEEIECESLVDAFAKTSHWEGIEINLVYEKKMCSVIIINEKTEKTTIIFCEPKTLFEKQWATPLNRADLLNLFTNFMAVFKASFCVFEPEWIRCSRTQQDIDKWLDDVRQGMTRDWEWVIINDQFISQEAVPNFAKTYFWETLPKPMNYNHLNTQNLLARLSTGDNTRCQK